MAGTLFGLSLSQRVDLNAKPAVGWLLYLYQANTSTPVTSYLDVALTVANPWPIPADGYGMMRQFWLADGNYRARGTSADGSITYFDQLSILAIGASSGAAPSGGVDPTAIFQVGDVMWLDRQGTRTGWVRDNARTIGSATSGAAERANSDAQPLFEYLWNTFSDGFCPVISGRGGSSLADWTANKQITTPDKRGYGAGGLDDMGNTVAGSWASVPIILGGVTTAGSRLGEALHTISVSEMAPHTHSGTTGNDAPDHTHNATAGLSSGLTAVTQGGATTGVANSAITTGGASARHQHLFTSDTGAGVAGNAHNNTPLTVLGTFYRKL